MRWVALVGGCVVVGGLGCGVDEASAPELGSSRALVAGEEGRVSIAPFQSDDDAVVVYESMRRVDRGGRLLEASERGELTPEMRQRAARPSSYLGEGEPYLYEEDSFFRTGKDGVGEYVYRVLRRPNSKPVAPREDLRKMRVMDRFEAATQEDGKPLLVLIKVRGYRTWNVPLPPDDSASLRDQYEQWTLREAAMAALQKDFEAETRDLRTYIEQAGGEVVDVKWETGWLYVRTSSEVARSLRERSDIVTLDVDSPMHENCNSSCVISGSGGTGPDAWRLGEARRADRMNLDVFRSAGISGEQSNSGYHGWGDINVAIIERNGQAHFEDEATFMDDWQSGPSRIAKRVVCSSNSNGSNQTCTTSSNFADSDSGTSHPTWIMSIIASDLLQSQARSLTYGDSCYDGVSHCYDWRNASTGMAPEASLQLWAGATSQYTLDNAINAIATSGTGRSDIISMSTSHHESPRCNVNSGFTFEDALEVAFNEGIFLVNGPENAGGAATDPCNLDSPGDLPVVFTVNGFDSSASACRSDYKDCVRSVGASAVGGADLTINGYT